MRLVDITGMRFGRLVALSHISVFERDRRRIYWKCLCNCGKSKLVSPDSLRRGVSQSCGCKQREETSLRRCTHGHTPVSGWSATYKTWTIMLQRCSNPNHMNYKYYGGRGISVCAHWHKFENFLADMGERPAGLSIDRIDVNGNYEPSNCRWVDQKTQVNNRRPK